MAPINGPTIRRTRSRVRSHERPGFLPPGAFPRWQCPVNAPAGAQLEITYYTDPLCCWSWAFEPVWRRLLHALGPQVRFRYRMSGMIPDWRRYVDPLNDIASPSHMGPQWLEVSRASGMPIAPEIWHDDPPASSYPACFAVKAAALQGEVIGDRYLRRLREAVTLERRNIARREVLIEMAEASSTGAGGGHHAAWCLDVGRFMDALDDGSALAALRDDMRETRDHEIARFLTLVIRGAARNVLLVGYRPYEQLVEAVQAAAGAALALPSKLPSAREYAAFWSDVIPHLTDREVDEACGPGVRPTTDSALPLMEAIAT